MATMQASSLNVRNKRSGCCHFVFGLTVFWDSILVYTGPEESEKADGRKKCLNNPNPHLLQAQ